MEEEMRGLEQQMHALSGEALEAAMERYSRLSHEFEEANGYAVRSEITGVIKGLGFSESDFDRPAGVLSGGEKTRVALGKLLLSRPDLILLDEPVQFLMRGDSGALITIQDNKAVPLRFEDIKDPATGKTKVRKVNINSVHYKIARGSMMRLEKEDLDDPGLANAYHMTQDEFRKRYAYLFEAPDQAPAKAAKK